MIKIQKLFKEVNTFSAICTMVIRFPKSHEILLSMIVFKMYILFPGGQLGTNTSTAAPTQSGFSFGSTTVNTATVRPLG